MRLTVSLLMHRLCPTTDEWVRGCNFCCRMSA